MTSRFKIEACFTDRNEALRTFGTGAAAKAALAEYNQGVHYKEDRCGPVFWRLSVFVPHTDNWQMICERRTAGDCTQLLEVILDAARS